MYKDPDKQREADRERQRRYRANRGLKAYPKGVTNSGCDKQGVTEEALQILKQADEIITETDAVRVVPATLLPNMPTCDKPIESEEMEEICKCCERHNQFGCANKKGKIICEVKEALIAYKIKNNIELPPNWKAETVTKTEIGKRGKDIKCFEDLPLDVQQSIDMMSVVEGRIDQTIKANRTAIAVHYQHLFPDRYYSTGVA